MQKLDYIMSLGKIYDVLNIGEILAQFELASNTNEGRKLAPILPLLLDAKSNMFNLTGNSNTLEILTYTKLLEEIFDNSQMSRLVTDLSELDSGYFYQAISRSRIMALYTAYAAIDLSIRIARESLSVNRFEDSDEALKEGLLVLQIAINDNLLTTDDYAKIMKNIGELIEAVGKVFQSEEDVLNKVVLLDSGSDTNVGIETKVEVARSIFMMFKEMWDSLVNRKFHLNKMKNDEIVNSLTIMQEIDKKLHDGVIDADTAKMLKHNVLTRMNGLINMGVWPKEIVMDKSNTNNRNLIEELTKQKLLEDPEQGKGKANN